MRPGTRIAWLVLTPGLLLSLALIGCSGKEDIKVRKDRRKTDETEKTDSSSNKDGAQPAGSWTEIKGTGTGTLKGVVTLAKGSDPPFDELTDTLLKAIKAKESDAPHCLKGSKSETTQFSWVVDKGTRGIKNVFVWVRPEDENKQFFNVEKLVKEGKGFDKVKVIDQPHCAFEPHALVLFPRYVDPAKPSRSFKLVPDKGGPPSSGQVFKVKNSAPLQHNTDWGGGGSTGYSKLVAPMSELTITDIQPSYKGPVTLKCSIHTWMKAFVWAFDHPFAAVTNDKGEFTIEGIPAGVKLRVVAWHEEAKWINGVEKGEDITLKEGDNTKSFEVKYSKGE
jgi:hypothetical protein